MLRLEGITKIYNPGDVSEICLFKDFSLSVSRGDFISVVGSNGSGKTSLLNIITGAVAPDGGRVLISGREVTGLPSHKIYAKVGRVYQNPALGTAGELTVYENMCLANEKGGKFGLGFFSKRREEELCERLLSLGMGLEDKLHTRAGALSGGQRQALALLMATSADIDLLILDEHTAALDPRSAERVMELTDEVIRERGLTALMVTHNLRYATEYGNGLIMMHKGRVVLEKHGEEKNATEVKDLLSLFNEISTECGN